MKTLARHPELFPHGPMGRSNGPFPKAARVFLTVLIFALVLGIGFQYVATLLNGPNPVVRPQPGLELILSGVLTSNLSFRADDLSEIRCTPSGFTVQSLGHNVTPIELSLSGLRGEPGSYELLGSNSTLALTAAGARYTLQSGNVTTSPGLRTFTASLTDAQSQPLQISGRLSCP